MDLEHDISGHMREPTGNGSGATTGNADAGMKLKKAGWIESVKNVGVDTIHSDE